MVFKLHGISYSDMAVIVNELKAEGWSVMKGSFLFEDWVFSMVVLK